MKFLYLVLVSYISHSFLQNNKLVGHIFSKRLDRLFVLLETGSTPATRRAAAQQLGQVQKLHPHELPQLLSRVQKCLRSSSWETRVAAGQAVEAIVSQIPQWNPPGIEIKNEHRPSVIVKSEPDGKTKVSTCSEPPPTPTRTTAQAFQAKKARLAFESFNVDRLLSPDAQFLMASEARLFDNVSDQSQTGGVNDAARQRNLINQRLGLDIAEKIGIDTSDIVSNEDLIIDDSVCSSSAENNVQVPTSLPTPTTPVPPSPSPFQLQRSDSGVWDSDEPMSSRQLNLAKRRARKQKSREAGCDSGDGGSNTPGTNGGKKFKREDSISFELNGDGGNAFAVGEDVWPLSIWVDVLINDLFSPSWEIRHGSATALREVIRLHGKGGGRETTILATEVCALVDFTIITTSLKKLALIMSQLYLFVEF